MSRAKRMFRSESDRMIFGVAGGMAEYFDIDPALSRIGWVALGFASGGLAILIYVIMAIVVPKSSKIAPQPASADGETTATATADADGGRDGGRLAAYWLGGALILFGAAFLLHNLGAFDWGVIPWGTVWPLGLIALGVLLLVSRLRR